MNKPALAIAAIVAAGAGVALTGTAGATYCTPRTPQYCPTTTVTTTTAKPTTTTSTTTTVPETTTTTVADTTTTTSTTVPVTTTTTVPTDIGTPLSITREQAPPVVADPAPISYTG